MEYKATIKSPLYIRGITRHGKEKLNRSSFCNLKLLCDNFVYVLDMKMYMNLIDHPAVLTC